MREGPMPGVGSWIERRSRSDPGAVALLAGDRTLTYAALADRIRRLANGLAGLGVSRGDRVAWIGPNHPAFLESLFAANLLGAALAPVNHRLPAQEVGFVLEDVEPTVVVRNGVEPKAVPPSVQHVLSVQEPADGEAWFEDLIMRSAADAVEAAIEPEDLCFLAHTSGTSGRPKGVMLTHANVTWNVVNFLSCADVRPGDVTVAIAPFFRVGGTGVNVLPVLFLGGTVVAPERGDPDEILRLMAEHRVSVGFGNPDSLAAMAGSPLWPDADLSSLRFIVTGGAPVPERLLRTFADRGLPLLQGYGLSEAGPLALLLDPASALRNPGSAGRPPMFVDVRIEGTGGALAGPGETGELLLRGPNVMAGYWRNPEATRRTLTDDGWLRTGDAARMDDEGFVWIVDRVKDAFVVDDRTVYPGDVERALLAHPAVADAGVVGTADASRGIVGVAFVVLESAATPTEDELRAHAAERLPPHQVPASITVVEELPRNSVGKLVRDELRTRLRSASPSA